VIDSTVPYVFSGRLEGVSALLFHRWSVDGVEAKAKAAKGSKAKKSDDLESYVYRNLLGELALPCEYVRMAMIHAAKYKQDPRSPRKSAMDLFKAGLAGVDELCSLGVEKWDYIDRRRAVVQRSGITRHRPAMLAGWVVTVRMSVLLPEYVSPALANEVLQAAGRLIGVGDFRPTYGRFQVTAFDLFEA
jgi:hypothetical protein